MLTPVAQLATCLTLSKYRMKQFWIFPLEPLDARYTKQWYDEVPNQLERFLGNDSYELHNAIGKQNSGNTTKGGFLNFADTNYWKSTQIIHFIEEMYKGNVADDAILLFTDFWNPAILQITYMRDLLDKNWTIHGIAHAGAYDPSDILGLKMQKPWPYEFERSVFYALDHLYFATEFHRDIFLQNLNIPKEDHHRAVISGQPYMYLIDTLAQYKGVEKKERIMWPHRYNDDKQPEIAEDLSEYLDVFITQKFSLSKSEYYAKLAESKIVFSCSLHENLGMSMIEGTLVDCIPIAPDRAAYSEIYLPEFLYPSEWTESFDAYTKHKSDILSFITDRLYRYDEYVTLLPKQREKLIDYINADVMFKHMSGDKT